MKNLKIDKPCPVYLSKDALLGNGFSCKGCNKHVIDFTNMSEEELLNNLKPNTCGIFTPEQIPQQGSYSGIKRMAFYSLMLLSFLGFQVKPMAASTDVMVDTTKNKGTTLVQKEGKQSRFQKQEDRKQEKVKNKRNRKSIFRKKRKFRPMGCPNF